MKILLVTSRWPWPARRGDQVRATQCVEALASGHHLTLLAPTPPAEREERRELPPGSAGSADGPPGLPPAALRIETYRPRPLVLRLPALVAAALAGRPLQGALFGSADLRRRLRALVAEADLVILQLARLAGVVDAIGDRPLVVDFIDSLALNLTTRAVVDRALFRPALLFEAARLARCEAALAQRATFGLVVAERDRAAILAAAPEISGERLRVLPLAVPGAQRAGGVADAKGDAWSAATAGSALVLTGNLGYFPNADGARWFLDRVWPGLARQRPELTLTLAGARPGGGLVRAARAAGAKLLDAPPSLAAVLAEATLALAPLRCGSGVPIKVLEAWAAGVPVVASPWAAEGVGGVDGHDLAIADTPAAWQAAILRLLDAPAARAALAAAGRARLEAHHAPGIVAEAWCRAAAQASARGC